MEKEELMFYKDYLERIKDCCGVYKGHLEKKPVKRSLTLLVEGFYLNETYEKKLEYIEAIEDLIGTKAFVLRNELKSLGNAR